jgi:hypothetical protein
VGYQTPRNLQRRVIATLAAVASVVLLVGYLGSASTLQEDLKSPAEYAAQHVQMGDVLALPDHAITSAVDYYLAGDRRLIPLWPQLGVRQRYVEGLDLSLDPAGHLPHQVWLLSDGSVPGVTRFERALERDGYVGLAYKQFDGTALLVFQSTLPVTTIFTPSSGATLSGTSALLDASARSSLHEIAKVQFVLSGEGFSRRIIGTATIAKFGFYLTWNTTSVPNGTYTLQSLATDATGKAGYSPAVAIKVHNEEMHRTTP